MLRYLTLVSVLAVLGLTAAARFGDLRPDARLHPAPWVLEWQAGQAHTLFLTGEDGADLRLGSRALGLEGIALVDGEGQANVLGSAEGCLGSVYTAEDPGQTIWLPPGSAVEIVPCPNRPADAALTLELFTRSGDAGRNIVSYSLEIDDSSPVITSPATGSTLTASAGSNVVTVEASDPDGDLVTFSVSGGSGVFGIGADGVLYVNSGARAKGYNLTITAVAGGVSASIDVTVKVQ